MIRKLGLRLVRFGSFKQRLSPQVRIASVRCGIADGTRTVEVAFFAQDVSAEWCMEMREWLAGSRVNVRFRFPDRMVLFVPREDP